MTYAELLRKHATDATNEGGMWFSGEYMTMLASMAESIEAENAKLREDLEFERSENGWAREFLNRMGEKCGIKDCPSLVAYVTKLEAENSKLRDLAARMLRSLKWSYRVSNSMYWPSFSYERELRELGVEVGA